MPGISASNCPDVGTNGRGPIMATMVSVPVKSPYRTILRQYHQPAITTASATTRALAQNAIRQERRRPPHTSRVRPTSPSNPRPVALARHASPTSTPKPTKGHAGGVRCRSESLKTSDTSRHKVREASKVIKLSLLTEPELKINMGLKATNNIASRAKAGRSGQMTRPRA